jgi:sirohydrochlorin ferrochelatase
MTGVLLLAHGSREGDTEKTMRRITEYVREELGDILIEEAYLQFRNKNLEKGLESLTENGADEIKIIPYFLFEGVHIKEDIPAEINMFVAKHPNVRVSMGKTLGADRRLAEIIVDRIRQVG